MNRVVALDLSSRRGGAALLERDPEGQPRVVAAIEDEVRRDHMVRLFGWIESLFAESGCSRDEIDGYAATHGPGSFTGIRVALGTLRGLGLATGRPCVGITTLAAIAEAHGPATLERVPLMPAGKEQVYGARYDAAGSPPGETLSPELAASDRFLSSDPALILAPPEFQDDAERRGHEWAPTPSGVAAAAGRLAMLRPVQAAGVLAPLYLRPPDVREPKRK